jgi:hypothetical protein
MTIKAVFFDVGETLIDETRHWGVWADHLRVPRLTFFAALGAVLAEGRHHREVFRLFDPDFDYRSAWEARPEAYEFLPSDFYPDAIPCFRELKELGYVIGIAGNQPLDCEAALARQAPRRTSLRRRRAGALRSRRRSSSSASLNRRACLRTKSPTSETTLQTTSSRRTDWAWRPSSSSVVAGRSCAAAETSSRRLRS